MILRSYDCENLSIDDSLSDATFTINWQQSMTKDTDFTLVLESIHIVEATPNSMGLANLVSTVEIDEIVPNCYDSHVGGNAATLASFRGTSYQAGVTDCGLLISSPRWQNGQINLKIKNFLGGLLGGTGYLGWIATLLYYPTK